MQEFSPGTAGNQLKYKTLSTSIIRKIFAAGFLLGKATNQLKKFNIHEDNFVPIDFFLIGYKSGPYAKFFSNRTLLPI